MATLTRYLTTTLILLVSLSAMDATADEIGISAEISNTSMAFDAKDTLTINLVWEGEPFLYQIDDFPMPTLEKLEILGSSSSVSTSVDSTISAGERTTRTFRYILQPTDFGTGIISPLNLTAKNRLTEEVHDLQTGRLTVEIAKPRAKVEAPSGGNGLVIIIIIIIVIVGTVVGYLLYRKKHRREDEAPADLSYIETLKEIKKDTVSDRKLFYSRLYRLLLAYLEKEKGMEVSGKTGEEVIRIVNEMEDDAEKAGLYQWLNQAQKVKYRPEAPSSGDVESTYNALYKFFESKLQNR